MSGLRGTSRGPGDIDGRVGLPNEMLEKIGIDQKLAEKISLETTFVDEHGKSVKLSSFFGEGKPVILVPAYYRCRLICNRVLDGLFDGLKRIDGKFRPGDHFEVVVVSFDHEETPEIALAKKEAMLSILGRRKSVNGWHFLTGTKENIKSLMDAVGYRFQYDKAREEYLHATGIMVLTPNGQISRYLLGIRYMPTDLELSLVESSGNRIGTLVDQIKLMCYTYDPHSGQYTMAVLTLLRIGAVLTMVCLFGFMFWNPLKGLLLKPSGSKTGNLPADSTAQNQESQERQAKAT